MTTRRRKFVSALALWLSGIVLGRSSLNSHHRGYFDSFLEDVHVHNSSLGALFKDTANHLKFCLYCNILQSTQDNGMHLWPTKWSRHGLMDLLCLLARTSLSGFSLEAKQFDRMSRKKVERIQSVCRVQKWKAELSGLSLTYVRP